MRLSERLIEAGLFGCALLSVGTTIGIIVVLSAETVAFLREVPITEFLFGTEWTPLFAVQRFGVLPLVSSLSEDAMRGVPRGLREGSYALGATKMETSLKVVVPAAFSGITAAFILAVSRAIGETMIVAIAAGQQPRLTMNPTDPVATMTAFIVQVSLGDTPTGTLAYRTIFAVGMLLFVGTFSLNLVSAWLRTRYREEYA